MPEFGSFSLLLALALSGYTLVAGGIALRQLATGWRGRMSPDRLAETARRAGIASFFAVTCAAFALVYGAFANDFSVSYILHHSNRALPGPYKFAALWSGQEGSLLLWAWLLTGYGFVLRLRHKVDVTLTAYASTILAGIQIFFLLLLNFAAPPFALVQGQAPADGFGLNPLLQYPEMVIHPPMLYLGYVGFTVPFAFALGALMMRYPGEKWIHITRRWTMVTWLFLTCGIFLGAHWAYSVLGWGGYWGWDPVENASLMPWLTGTAFLHSVMMQEKRGMMKNWNVWLIFSTFLLCILGTLLTRSGLVSSVHAFAQSSIGSWFNAFLVIVLSVCLFTFLLQRDHLKSEHKMESLVSRESSFLFNNLVLLAACFTILWGTLFPIISEYVQGNKVTVGAPFYNRVAATHRPLSSFPHRYWAAAGVALRVLQSIRRNFILPTAPWSRPRSYCSPSGFARGRTQAVLFPRCLLARRRRHHRHFFRVSARRQRHPQADRQKHFRRHGAAHPPQHAPLWRLHRPLRRGGHLHRHCRRRLQPKPRAGNEQWPKHDHRALQNRVPELHPGHQSQLRYRVRPARRLSRQQEGHPARAGEALLHRFATSINHGGKPLHAGLGPVRDLRRQESRQRLADHQGLPQSAHGLDLDRGRGGRLGTLVALVPNLSAALASGRTRSGVAEGIRPPVTKPRVADEPEVAIAGRSRS